MEDSKGAGRHGRSAEDGEGMSDGDDDELESAEDYDPGRVFGAPLTAYEELNALFKRGFIVPPALRMNSIYGKFASSVQRSVEPEGYRALNGDWVVPYPPILVDHARLLKIVSDEVRIIRGEARVI